MNIVSINNEKIKNIIKLKQKKYREKEKCFLIEGDHLVDIALSKGLIKTLITTNDNYNFENTYFTTKEIMKKISNQETSTDVIGVCPYLKEREPLNKVLILDRLQDPGNLGTIIRSSVAFNFDTIILGEGTVDVYNEKVIRASEGMIFNTNIIKRNLKEEIKHLKEKGYLIVTTDVNNGIDIKNIKENKIALVIGNEGSGVSNEISTLCDKKVNIKMNKNCESLNAAVCASILMYEVNNE